MIALKMIYNWHGNGLLKPVNCEWKFYIDFARMNFAQSLSRRKKNTQHISTKWIVIDTVL